MLLYFGMKKGCSLERNEEGMEEEWGEQEHEGRGQKEGRKREGKANPH